MIDNHLHIEDILLAPPESVPEKTVSREFLSYVMADEVQEEFAALLSRFLVGFFDRENYKPLRYSLSLYHDPESDSIEPMIQITYPNDDLFDVIDLIKQVNHQFAEFLCKHKFSEELMAQFNRLYRKYRVILEQEREELGSN